MRPGSVRRGQAIVAAIVNGIVVLFLPLLVIVVAGRNEYSATVHPPGWSPVLAGIRTFAASAPLMLPLALLAAWRTWVHAERRNEGNRGWQGVAEAGACGFAIALLVLGRGILGRPLETLPYVIVYGGLALLVGLSVGLLLYVTAWLTLTLTASLSG